MRLRDAIMLRAVKTGLRRVVRLAVCRPGRWCVGAAASGLVLTAMWVHLYRVAVYIADHPQLYLGPEGAADPAPGNGAFGPLLTSLLLLVLSIGSAFTVAVWLLAAVGRRRWWGWATVAAVMTVLLSLAVLQVVGIAACSFLLAVTLVGVDVVGCCAVVSLHAARPRT